MQILNSTVFGIPVWVLAVGLIGGGIAIYLLRRNRSSSASGVLGQNATASPAPTDPNIDPNTGVPYAVEQGINPNTGLPNYYGGPGINQQSQVGNVRTSGSVPGYSQYDTSHPQGVPIDSQPGGGTVTYVPFGSQLQIIGAGVQGPPNTTAPGAPSSTLWYPVAGGGYINAQDLNGSPHGGARGPDTGTEFWPYMTDMAIRR